MYVYLAALYPENVIFWNVLLLNVPLNAALYPATPLNTVPSCPTIVTPSFKVPIPLS